MLRALTSLERTYRPLAAGVWASVLLLLLSSQALATTSMKYSLFSFASEERQIDDNDANDFDPLSGSIISTFNNNAGGFSVGVKNIDAQAPFRTGAGMTGSLFSLDTRSSISTIEITRTDIVPFSNQTIPGSLIFLPTNISGSGLFGNASFAIKAWVDKNNEPFGEGELFFTSSGASFGPNLGTFFPFQRIPPSSGVTVINGAPYSLTMQLQLNCQGICVSNFELNAAVVPLPPGLLLMSSVFLVMIGTAVRGRRHAINKAQPSPA